MLSLHNNECITHILIVRTCVLTNIYHTNASIAILILYPSSSEDCIMVRSWKIPHPTWYEKQHKFCRKVDIIYLCFSGWCQLMLICTFECKQTQFVQMLWMCCWHWDYLGLCFGFWLVYQLHKHLLEHLDFPREKIAAVKIWYTECEFFFFL